MNSERLRVRGTFETDCGIQGRLSHLSADMCVVETSKPLNLLESYTVKLSAVIGMSQITLDTVASVAETRIVNAKHKSVLKLQLDDEQAAYLRAAISGIILAQSMFK